MAGYEPYPSYSVDDTPADWKRKRLRFALKMNPSKSEIRLRDDDPVSFVPMDAVGEYGGIRLNEEKELGEIGSGYTDFRDDDVIAAKITPCFENGKGALARGLKNQTAFGTTELHVLRADRKQLEPDFLFYLTISDLFRKLGESEMYGAGGQKRVPENFFKDFQVSLPSIGEQKAIARFLDFKTAQIDTLIAKKKTLLEKLVEKRTALISHAVTKGLDPSVPMKDSGVEWLGEIPAHWNVIALRYACEFLNHRRIPLSSEERGVMSERIYPYYGASGIIDYVENYIFDEKTILIAEDGANLLLRSTPLALIADGRYWVNNHAHIIKPTTGPFEFWANLLCIIKYDPWITGSAQPKLSKENLGGVKLPLPPREEQIAIGSFISDHSSEINPMAEKVTLAIERLLEYRSALITSAVTGKIDVRDFPIPQHTAESAHA